MAGHVPNAILTESRAQQRGGPLRMWNKNSKSAPVKLRYPDLKWECCCEPAFTQCIYLQLSVTAKLFFDSQ